MRILICGGRDFTDKLAIMDMLRRAIEATVVIHGGAWGADRLAGMCADELGIDSEVYHPMWKKHGTKAGFIRNQVMIDLGRPDEVWAFPTQKSVGTWDMIEKAEEAGITTKVIK